MRKNDMNESDAFLLDSPEVYTIEQRPEHPVVVCAHTAQNRGIFHLRCLLHGTRGR